MIIETRSGSKYIFSVHEGKIYLLHQAQEYIIPTLPAITIGKPLEFEGYKLNMLNCVPSTSETFFKSTPVVAVRM